MTTTSLRVLRTLGLGLVPLLVIPGQAQADSIWLTGAEAARSSQYLYLGTVLPLGQHKLGQGWVQRYWVDAIRYEYESGSQTIRARGAGLEAAIGYQFPRPDGWFSIYGGARWNNTNLSPDDPSNDSRGTHLRPKLQIEGDSALAGVWRINGVASYIFDQKAYWGRLRLAHKPGDIAWGMEAVRQGDPSYNASQIGVFTDGWRAGETLRMGFKAGVRRSEGENSPYAGVEFFLPLD